MAIFLMFLVIRMPLIWYRDWETGFPVRCFPVTISTCGATNSHGVTGGVYKARERIHRGMLIRDY